MKIKTQARVPHKVMTLEGYLIKPLKGWHEIIHYGDGTVGVRYLDVYVSPQAVRKRKPFRDKHALD